MDGSWAGSKATLCPPRKGQTRPRIAQKQVLHLTTIFALFLNHSQICSTDLV